MMETDFLSDFTKRKRRMHFALFDPDNQAPAEAGRKAALCASYGSDAVMIGGSTVKDQKLVHETVEEIKKQSGLPTILFPNSAGAVSGNADYIFFMMLLNSMDRRFLIGEQIKGAALIKRSGVKPIPMGYVIISTSEKPTTVEKAAALDRIGADDVEKAVQYAVATESLGMKCVYLEAGSGAEKPVPDRIIAAVRQAVDIPIIAGGGIRDPATARAKIDAGADAIVNGTACEENCLDIKAIVAAIKK